MKKISNDKVKNEGQIFTPQTMAEEMLGICGCFGIDILDKHIIDNSCGNGVFLLEALKKYYDAYIDYRKGIYEPMAFAENVVRYIHGIELSEELCDQTKKNLDDLFFMLTDVHLKLDWDIRCQDALTCTEYDGKMDYVVGNPPYVRIHNLSDQYETVRKYMFAEKGMVDLYLPFFEKGFEMLADNGTLCYITPSSWVGNKAGRAMRDYLKEGKDNIRLEYYQDNQWTQVFKGFTTYTAISVFRKSEESLRTSFTNEEKVLGVRSIEDSFIGKDNVLFTGSDRELTLMKRYSNSEKRKEKSKYKVRNGYATLSDKIFFNDDVPDSNVTIPIVKASTGNETKGIYPYRDDGEMIWWDEMDADATEYLNGNKELLMKGGKGESDFYLYGRTQAINDTYKHKLAVGTLMDKDGVVHITEALSGTGVYGGLYVTMRDKDEVFGIDDERYVTERLQSEDFVTYVKSLRKYKSGGYYSFTAKDVETFLSVEIEDVVVNNHLDPITELYHDGEFVGEIHNYTALMDVQTQIYKKFKDKTKRKNSGYYIIFNGERMDIQNDGRIKLDNSIGFYDKVNECFRILFDF